MLKIHTDILTLPRIEPGTYRSIVVFTAVISQGEDKDYKIIEILRTFKSTHTVFCVVLDIKEFAVPTVLRRCRSYHHLQGALQTINYEEKLFNKKCRYNNLKLIIYYVTPPAIHARALVTVLTQ